MSAFRLRNSINDTKAISRSRSAIATSLQLWAKENFSWVLFSNSNDLWRYNFIQAKQHRSYVQQQERELHFAEMP